MTSEEQTVKMKKAISQAIKVMGDRFVKPHGRRIVTGLVLIEVPTK